MKVGGRRFGFVEELGAFEICPIYTQLPNTCAKRSNWHIISSVIRNNCRAFRKGVEPFSMRASRSVFRFATTEFFEFTLHFSICHGAHDLEWLERRMVQASHQPRVILVSVSETDEL